MEDASSSATELTSSPPPALPSKSRRSNRKRSRPSFYLNESTPSDPAMFSSDPPDPSAEHYFEPRMKKQYRGTWWGQEGGEAGGGAKRRKKQSEFSRNLDSGVWMGSDSTESSGVSEAIVADEDAEAGGLIQRGLPARPWLSRRTPEPKSVKIARQRIDQCVEEGSTDLFLANLGLPYLNDDMLAPLRSLIQQPHYFDGVGAPEDEEFEPWSPDLCLDVGGNALQALPPALFELFGSIQILDASNNNLTSLLPLVSRLAKLKSLYLRGNRLRWLPYELIPMVMERNQPLDVVDATLNPLFQPFFYLGLPERPWTWPQSITELKERVASYTNNTDLQSQHREWMVRLCEHYIREPEILWFNMTRSELQALPEEEKSELLRRWGDVGKDENGSNYDFAITRIHTFTEHSQRGTLHHYSAALATNDFLIAATPISYMNFNGLPSASSTSPPSMLPEDHFILPAKLIDFPNDPYAGRLGLSSEAVSDRPSRVKSLFELALLSASKVPELPDLHKLLPEYAPTTVTQGLETACTAREEGGRICSVCGSNYITPRTEWIEYWHVWMHRLPDMGKRETLFWPYLRRGCTHGCVPKWA